ncbi:putative leucine-rich repeat-containing protein DDB_G0290503 isoform X6 [Palaemon carinicauda]|uniref:putative leucine-rich repeat-containing protein DDB_G0290503 isoform X6 n=1 Tax=Palaemon carinicauda TaxID=392227 RepID=UPI0035B622DB
MPIKNGPSTTWYKPPPVHRSPSPTRHAFQQVTQSHSRPGTQVTGQPQSTQPPKHMPIMSPSGLPSPTSLSMKQATSLPSSQVPPSSGQVYEHADGQVPTLPASKLPTSTSGSSFSSSSPKRSIPQTKIASPTRLRNTDRLPPIAKGVTTAPGGTADKGDVVNLKAMTPIQKDKKKDGKESKEKMNENRSRRSNSVEKKANRENSRSRKTVDENVTTGMTTSTKKKTTDNINKLDTKGIVIIPKRKKSSERSNSENEIKPKKISMKELPAISAKTGDSVNMKATTDVSSNTSFVRRSPSKDRSSKSPEKPALKNSSKPGRKISPTGSSSTVSLSNKKLRPSSLQVFQKDPLKDVEKMLKEMDVGKNTNNVMDETDLGRSIERSLESAISAKEAEEINAMECNVTEMEETEENAMVMGGFDDDVQDICMEEESVEGEYNVQEEERIDVEDGTDVDRSMREKEENESVGAVVVRDHELAEDMRRGSEINVSENIVFASESLPHLSSQVDITPPASIQIDDSEDAATDQSMRDEDILNDGSNNDTVEIGDHSQTERPIALDQSMEDTTLIVALGADGTVEDVVLMDDTATEVSLSDAIETSGKSEEEGKGGGKMESIENAELQITKADVKKTPKEKTESKVSERESKMKSMGNALKMMPKPLKKMPEKQLKKEIMLKKDTRNQEEAKPKKGEEEVTNGERRTKRKMDMDKTRGGTKKPAILFVDKGSTASGEGGDSRASRDSRVLTANRVNISNGEKKRSEASAPPRRPRLDNVKSTIPKPGRLPPRKLTDPVKAARPGGPTSGPRGPHLGGHGGNVGPGQQERQHPVPHAEQLRRLDAELTARATELKVARTEKDLAERRVEALTVLIHHLNNTYEPFLCPTLKAEVVRLNQQLTDTRLSLDESTAAVRRLQEEATQSIEKHSQKVQELEQKHKEALGKLIKQHQHDLDLAIEKHRKEMGQFAEDQQKQREDLSRAHAAEIENLEGEWRTKLDVQHERHLCAVQELNTQHTHKLRELESSRQAREFELEEANSRLQGEQEALKIQSKKLEESLLNDTDHRLQAVRNMCSSLKSEVDSLKTVVEMKNSEIHTLRGQVVEMGRLSKELEVARDRAKSLQAKTEDLQAQMEKRALSERHLVNEHRLLMETCQREANINKRLSLENEELAWKLRQREEMYTSLPSSTLDLVSRSPATPRRQEGAPSPQAAPHSPRVAVRSPSGKISPSKCEVNKRRSRLGLSSEDGVNGDDRVQDVSIDSPPPSPCVKAVVEKSNSVSFILDLNDSQSDDSFLDLPPSPRPRPQRTASLSAADRPRTPIHARRVIHNNRANSLNRNGVHLEGRQNSKCELNGKRKEVNGKSHDTNGHGSQPSSGRSASESSEGGSEIERVSPTGLAWTVPVHPPKSPVKTNALRQNGSPVRGRVEHHLLEDPDEDEYEETPEGTHQFIEVVELSRVGLVSSSEAASDSELSQCDLIKGGSSTDSDSESSDGEPHTQQGSSKHHEQLARKNGPWCPKEGAGEAMITDDLLKQYSGDTLAIEPLPTRGKRPPRRCFPSAPSSDSDDNMNAHNEGTAVDVSWSEDITSSSEMHEL